MMAAGYLSTGTCPKIPMRKVYHEPYAYISCILDSRAHRLLHILGISITSALAMAKE